MEVYLVKGLSNSYLTSGGVLVDAGASVKDVLRAAGSTALRSAETPVLRGLWDLMPSGPALRS